MPRIAHLVVSTHWDREWYDTFQGFRMRLVSLLDEVFDTLDADKQFKSFTLDGQAILLPDYLEIHPEQRERITRFLREGRLKSGPWYVLPDEWLVSGESLVRNIQFGQQITRELGAEPSSAGIACDLFGHISQLPQILEQLGSKAAMVWRGMQLKDVKGYFNWTSPDGTVLPTYRFGINGYCSYAFEVRNCTDKHALPLTAEEHAKRLVEYTLREAQRLEGGPILLFDGGDHAEIEPGTSAFVAIANAELAKHDIRIVHSDLDAFSADVVEHRRQIHVTKAGELRESARDTVSEDNHWLIPGVLSSRVHLKQRNATCEDELCLWAEPFSTFAHLAMTDLDPTAGLTLISGQRKKGFAYPHGYLRESWRHLLENHPHDSICGCSIDQVHQDMIFRFDQSLGISSRLSQKAMKAIALASAPRQRPDGSLVLTLFNATSQAINDPVDIDIPLPTSWEAKFQEFFGFEEKFSFKLRRPEDDGEIPYQLVSQSRGRVRYIRNRYKFPTDDPRHVVTVTAKVCVPAFGFTTLIVEPVKGPTRYLGSMASSHRTIENEFLSVTANANGSIDLLDKRSGKKFEQLLTFEQRADIGDGWYHGQAVNDQIFCSTASSAEVALIHDGINKATLRIHLTMNVPKDFHRRTMTRCETLWPLKIVSDVTLRAGSSRVEVSTTVQNDVMDHRLRVLLPTHLQGETYLADSAFDVVERPVALLSDNAIRRELDVETRPQQTWTAFGDGKCGLAVVSRGLPESAVQDNPQRAIALTLFRSFRKAVFANDNLGGEIQGKLSFRFDIVPYQGSAPLTDLFRIGQRIHGAVRMIDLTPLDLRSDLPAAALPAEKSFVELQGDVVVTSLRQHAGAVELRLFNPQTSRQPVKFRAPENFKTCTSVRLDGAPARDTRVDRVGKDWSFQVPAKRIVTLRFAEQTQ